MKAFRKITVLAVAVIGVLALLAACSNGSSSPDAAVPFGLPTATGGGSGTAGTTGGNSGGGTSATPTTPSTPATIGTKPAPTAIGDIVFTDGSATAYAADLTLTDEQKSAAVAVVFKVDGTKAYGVGLKESTTTLSWCTNSADGYETNIAGSSTSDGSGNWDAICAAVDDEGTEGNYPAFEWANKYAATNGLTGDLATGWYIPAKDELETLYDNKAAVNASLAKCGAHDNLSINWYWSSSQYSAVVNSAYFVLFDFGHVIEDYKYYDFYVRVVRAFGGLGSSSGGNSGNSGTPTPPAATGSAGVSITLDSSDLALEKEVHGNVITLTVPEGYLGCGWYVDGEPIENFAADGISQVDENKISVNTNLLTSGRSYQIVVYAQSLRNMIPYSAHATVRK